MPDVLGLITARGGSKGIPRKNILPVGGKPLIAWTIEAARAARRLTRVVVSTDDEEIAAVSRQWGAEAPFLRPAAMAGDDSPHVLAVLHALEWLIERERVRPDYLVLLQPTSPLRSPADIDAAIHLAMERRAEAVVSVSETHDHPMLARRIRADGALESFVPCDLAYPRRQDLPKAYALNGAVYVFRVESLLVRRALDVPGALGYVMPADRSLQVDTPWDLRLAELILRAQAAEPAP